MFSGNDSEVVRAVVIECLAEEDAEDKEYVVMLDFIGNYRNNFRISIALSGDKSYNKDNIRCYVIAGGV